ncbi:hypothetical protein ACFQWF_05060 [Methylorubrum suomiense]
MTVIDGHEIGRPTCGPSMEDAAASRADMSATLARAAVGGQADVAFVAPLGFLHEGGVWTHLDVAVVSGGDPCKPGALGGPPVTLTAESSRPARNVGTHPTAARGARGS